MYQPGGDHGHWQEAGPIVKTTKHAGVPAFVGKRASQRKDDETNGYSDYWILKKQVHGSALFRGKKMLKTVNQLIKRHIKLITTSSLHPFIFEYPQFVTGEGLDALIELLVS